MRNVTLRRKHLYVENRKEISLFFPLFLSPSLPLCLLFYDTGSPNAHCDLIRVQHHQPSTINPRRKRDEFLDNCRWSKRSSIPGDKKRKLFDHKAQGRVAWKVLQLNLFFRSLRRILERLIRKFRDGGEDIHRELNIMTYTFWTKTSRITKMRIEL